MFVSEFFSFVSFAESYKMAIIVLNAKLVIRKNTGLNFQSNTSGESLIYKKESY